MTTARAILGALSILLPASAVVAQEAAQAPPAETPPAPPSRSDAVAASPIAREPDPGLAPVKPAPARTAAPAARKTQPALPDKPTAVIAALDKRLGTTAEFTLTPGERFTFGRLSGVMQSCERTQPFERKQSAAFVQVVEQPTALQGQAKPAVRTVFSGWLFAESPSLNPFVHPVYDVWLKSCTMRFPDGPKPPKAAPRSSSRKPAKAVSATVPEAD